MSDQALRRIQQQQQRRSEEAVQDAPSAHVSHTYELQRDQLEQAGRAIADILDPTYATLLEQTVAPQAHPDRARRRTLIIADEQLLREFKQPGGE